MAGHDIEIIGPKRSSEALESTKITNVSSQRPIAAVAEDNGICMYGPCHGRLECRLCIATVLEGSQNLATDNDNLKVSSDGTFLACQFKSTGPVKVIKGKYPGGEGPALLEEEMDE